MSGGEFLVSSILDTSDEQKVFLEIERLRDLGQLTIKYHRMTMRDEKAGVITRTIGVIPYGLNGDAKTTDFIGRVLVPAIKDVPFGQIGQYASSDIQRTFPRLWRNMYVIVEEVVVPSQYPSRVAERNGKLGIEELPTSH